MVAIACFLQIYLFKDIQIIKITLITNIPTPYRIPVWKEIHNKTDFRVICISKIEKNRSWNIENIHFITFLKSFHLFFEKLDWGFHFTIPFSLFFTLIKRNPDSIIITGYDNFQYWEALFYAKVFRKKTVFWNGSTLLSSRSKNKLVNALKRFFINRFDSYYTYGTKATEYLLSFGASKEAIVTGTNTVDTKFYKQNTQNIQYNTLHNGTKTFLFIGQLLERKGLTNTIKAFADVKSKNWNLIIVGTGSDEQMLRELILEKDLENNIQLVGYKQKEEVLSYLSNAEILLMPSYREVWGLVLNEGLASGLFCLSSKYAGATFDLVKEGVNGLILDPFNISEFTKVIEKTLTLTFDKLKIKNTIEVSVITESDKIISAVHKSLKGDR